MARPRKTQKARKRQETALMARRLERELGANRTPFKFTSNPETALRAIKNAAKRAGAEINIDDPFGIRWEYEKYPQPQRINLRGRGHLLFLPEGAERNQKAHEIAHAVLRHLYGLRGKILTPQISEGLATSFEMEYMTPEQRREVRPKKMHYDKHAEGARLAVGIMELAPKSSKKRSQMRKEVVEQGFGTAQEAIEYLKRHYN